VCHRGFACNFRARHIITFDVEFRVIDSPHRTVRQITREGRGWVFVEIVVVFKSAEGNLQALRRSRLNSNLSGRAHRTRFALEGAFDERASGAVALIGKHYMRHRSRESGKVRTR
jgi:hypothetical protein